MGRQAIVEVSTTKLNWYCGLLTAATGGLHRRGCRSDLATPQTSFDETPALLDLRKHRVFAYGSSLVEVAWEDYPEMQRRRRYKLL